MTAADKKVIIAAVILVFMSVALIFGRLKTANEKILVWKNGQKVMEVSVSRQGFFFPETGVQIEVRNGKARVTANDCPGKDCMKKGWISSYGDFIICAPKKLVIGFSAVNNNAVKQKISGADSVTY